MIKQAETSLLNVAYIEKGGSSQPAVLLLHGWPDDATTWNVVADKLAEAGFRTIAPFHRGFGTTTFKDESTPRTGNTAILTLDTIELMDALEIEKFFVIGHDWGSNIAEALAVGWPDRVLKMAQLSTPSRLGGLPMPPFEHAQLEWYHWFMATKRGQEAVSKDPVGFAHIMWVNWAPKNWFTEEEFQEVAKSWQNPDFVDVTLHSYQSRWDEAEPDEKSKELDEKVKSTQKLSLPSVFIQGQVDGVNPPETGENVQEKFTGPFDRIVIPGVGHFPTRENPQALSMHLINFLKE